MAIVNFAVKKPLDQKIKKALKEHGFNSKAEFFRLAAINFLQSENKRIDEDERMNYLASKLRRTIIRNIDKKKLPSLEKQLSDI
jgi:metal-responsive CopG/Arc/MetJ family transcriptional regulator